MDTASVRAVTGAVLVVIVCWLSFYVVRAWLAWRRRVNHILKIPHDEMHWLLGHLAQFPGPTEEGLAFMREKVAAEDGGRIGCVFYGPVNCSVALVHPETLKTIMKTSEPKPTVEGPYRFIKPWLGDGLLLSKDKKWARNRRLLTPAFHFDILRPYITVNNECLDILLTQMSGYAERKESWNAAEHISHLTLDILLRCAFSYDNDVQTRGSDHPYVKAIVELSDGVTNRLLSPWLYNDFVFFNLTPKGRRFRRNCDYVHKVSSDIIAARRKALNAGGFAPERRYLDFLDILLTARDNDGQGLSDQEIRDEADTFLFEGHDTTASAIMWTLYSLATEPVHQIRCRQEIDNLLNGRDSDYINWEDLGKLSYLTQCIKEALRIHVPVPFIQRQLTDDVTVDGYYIPNGTVVDCHLYALHHNPRVWKDSMKFDPTRFTTGNMAKMDPYAFIPFSAGPRNCIGQNFAMHELKVVIGRILHRFDLKAAEDKPPAKHLLSVVMRAENGVYLSLTPRT